MQRQWRSQSRESTNMAALCRQWAGAGLGLDRNAIRQSHSKWDTCVDKGTVRDVDRMITTTWQSSLLFLQTTLNEIMTLTISTTYHRTHLTCNTRSTITTNSSTASSPAEPTLDSTRPSSDAFTCPRSTSPLSRSPVSST